MQESNRDTARPFQPTNYGESRNAPFVYSHFFRVRVHSAFCSNCAVANEDAAPL
eukprot:NODE_2740_length_477_cov_69.273364_g2159_i0.p2 GENE.NODE_2740_length_477_cov_69.273364_g2159_i0~~NODE_2740_length_477_cov_69.273364_g2159_i0.p2  ORF type:complete len:54 (-),score=9.56 NODE_2740_length_477_cov_69.273364_g2159_i0:18-179(-)